MKNDRSITEVLAEELSISEQEASALISQWGASIQESLETRGEAKIEAFGTFKKSGGKVQFEPDDKFALEVNYKYAGMEPVEILPAYRKSDTEEQPEAKDIPPESDDVEEQVRKEPEKEKAQEKEQPEETVQEKPEDKAEKSQTREAPEKQRGQKENEKEIEPVKSEKSESPQKETDPFKGASAKKKETPGKLQKKTDSKVRKTEPSPANGKKSRNTEWIIVGGLAVLLIAGILHFIFFYDPTPQIPTSEDRITEETEPVAAAEEEAEDLSETEEPVMPEEPDEPEEVETAPEPADEQWGHTGSYVPMDEYFTIVIYSLRNRERAEEQYDEISNEGFRATLNAFRPDEDTQSWRVGIGQFESVSDAEEAAGELPDPWSSDHFIIRIR